MNKKIITYVVISLLTTTAFSQVKIVEINEQTFPDASFRDCIRQYDWNNDKILYDWEIARVTTMKVSSRYIQSLVGINYFTALETLECSNNKLTSLNISALVNLTTLDCSNNKIVALNISGLQKIERIDCSYNQITSLDVSSAINIKQLFCNGHL
jgi:Leucine-rich repeat (LRR) protein